jgi:hypothetical protein
LLPWHSRRLEQSHCMSRVSSLVFIMCIDRLTQSSPPCRQVSGWWYADIQTLGSELGLELSRFGIACFRLHFLQGQRIERSRRLKSWRRTAQVWLILGSWGGKPDEHSFHQCQFRQWAGHIRDRTFKAFERTYRRYTTHLNYHERHQTNCDHERVCQNHCNDQ